MIRKIVLLLTALCLLSISSSQAATLIESKDGEGATMKMWLAGSLIRIDMSNQPTYMLFDVDQQKMYAVDPAKREAMDMSTLFNKDSRNASGRPPYEITFDKQGKGPVIAGYSTVHYLSSVNGVQCTEEYLSKKAFDDIDSLAVFEMLSKMTDSAQTGMEMMMEPDPCDSAHIKAIEFYEKHGYPLKLVEIDGSVSSEVIRISSRVAKPQKDFQVPEGYRVMDLGQMVNEQMKYMGQGRNPQAMPQMNRMEGQEIDPAEIKRMLEQMMKDMEQK